MELLRQVPRERIELPGGHWVEVKTRLTVGERRKLQTSAFTVPGISGDKPTPTLDMANVIVTALQIGIVAWSLEDPVTPENVALLDEDSGEIISARLDELWATRSDDERKNSSAAGPTSGSSRTPKRRRS